ncbi:glycosyltransferase family 2 protein [Noviherbaspirillum humi]|nr:hypothetical protein [Noviherbaspirillum humi]
MPFSPTLPSARRCDAVLFTTCDLGSGRLDDLQRLLASVRRAVTEDGLSIIHYVLLQRAADGVPPPLLGDDWHAPRFMTAAARLPLSRARNLMLAQALRDKALQHAAWVAFPDDDAWYPPQLLLELSLLFACHPHVDLITCRYGSAPLDLSPLGADPAFRPAESRGEMVRRVSSNTLMLRASAALRTGFFDERLGLGAAINGGEDLDYALRSDGCRPERALISDEILVGHRDRLAWVRSRYYAGSLFALARAARRQPMMAGQAARKLLVGLALLAGRELGWREWRSGLRAGWLGWRLPDPGTAFTLEAEPHLVEGMHHGAADQS